MFEKIYQFFEKRPEASLCFGFLVLILVGTLFLKLPFSTYGSISFIDALFTATSAACVTGLVIKDTGTYFTLFGQIVILALIQLGALGIMIGATFIFLLIKKKFSLITQTSIKEELGINSVAEIKKTIKFIILSVFTLQILGAIFLFFSWQASFQSIGTNIFYSFFHSVSAFSNAGFSLFPNSLENFSGVVSVNIIFSSLIVLGGLGFVVLMDIWQYLFSWIKKGKRKISLYSKLILISSFLLLVLGACFFFVFERENILAGLPQTEVILVSSFQSVTRTAGFNTVDIENLTYPTFLLLIFLMFVGGAPASTAGGVKVITLFLILFYLYSFFRKKEGMIIFKKTISFLAFKLAFVIFSFFLLTALVFSLILLYTEDAEFKIIIFEVFSALGTVGLSAGLTENLSFFGRISIILLMFIGRMAPLVLIIIGVKRIIKSEIRYPEERITLG